MKDVNGVELTIFIAFFAVVTVVGFAAARWRRGQTIMHLDEWGLGGRSFGTFVTWFLLGGDLYSAYTFVAVPSAVFAGGAMGFWAVPYGAIAYPIVFLIGPRLWSVAQRHGYVTAADFVRGRYGSRSLGLAVALTGILAMMPYIALQLVGIQAVLTVMGVSGSGWAKDLPLFIAFALLAAYTYTSGLRAPALISFVKDALIYVVIIVAIVYIPTKLGGWDGVFDKSAAALAKPNPVTGKPAGSLFTSDMTHWAYGTLALGSSLALFIYPHSVTGALAAGRRDVIRRNAALLPAYSLLLGLLALLGYMALAHPGVVAAVKHAGNPQLAVPELFDQVFPDWFTGVAFAAIGVGALVPAAIMSIAASNLFTRNVYTSFIRPDASPEEETRVSQLVSLLVKLGALVFVLGFDKSLAINLQLLGGIWVVQTFPAIGIGLYTRWLDRWGLLAGWAAGMAYGTYTAYDQSSPAQSHFGSPLADIPFVGHTGYIALTAFVLNMVVAVAVTALVRAFKVPAGPDETSPDDYTADADDRLAAPEDPAGELTGQSA
ncbi:sodium:solute symporter family protein [Actinomadura nitritigenes]|uniref:Sodium:solute symporter n=1 Tax=Actinomadura nitritigenes TaxID=134602 RepID=A0ABS3R6W2_9ACTN|nr:sodium:solute symporter [Actinomadura nitritigenes]MBO2441979.1 sodium:solute symporter [Actinomadura nitritigenes]